MSKQVFFKAACLTAILFLLPVAASALTAAGGPCPSDPEDGLAVCLGYMTLTDMGSFNGSTFVYSDEFLSACVDPSSNPNEHPDLWRPKFGPVQVGSTRVDKQRASKEGFAGSISIDPNVSHERMRVRLTGWKTGAISHPAVLLYYGKVDPTETEDRYFWFALYNNCTSGFSNCDPNTLQPFTEGGSPLRWNDIDSVVWHHQTMGDIYSKTNMVLNPTPGQPAGTGLSGVASDIERGIQLKYDTWRKQWIRDAGSAANPLTFYSITIPWDWDLLPDNEDDSFEFTINFKNPAIQQPMNFKVYLPDMRAMPAIDTFITHADYDIIKEKEKKSGKIIIKAEQIEVTERQIKVRKVKDPNDIYNRYGLIIQWPEPDSIMFGMNPDANANIPVMDCFVYIYDPWAPRDPSTYLAKYAFLNVNSPLQSGSVVVPAWAWAEYKKVVLDTHPLAEEVALQIVYDIRDADGGLQTRNRGNSYPLLTTISLNDTVGD